jgi:hypothetical protein
MGKFNSAAATNKTTNLAGGKAYAMTPELELVSALLTSFLEDKFYQKGSDRITAITTAFGKVDPLFAAKAAIYARNEFGMRSVSHVVAGTIAGTVKGEEWTKRFFDQIVRRPDDMAEILSYYYANHGKNEPQAMRKGFRAAFARFDEYQLAKYRMTGKEINLVDIANLVHPAHSEAIAKLIRGELKNVDTFESKLSAAGKSKSDNAKGEAWGELLQSGKLGYMALLRNLRNIAEQAPEHAHLAAEQLVDEKKLRKSLVLPFRFISAADELKGISGKPAKLLLSAIGDALDMSVKNIPRFDGETVVMIDKSGSMRGDTIKRAALFAAMFVKANQSDVILWDNSAEYVNLNPRDSVTSIAQNIIGSIQSMGGTDISAPFREANQRYDRILILTDEQSWGRSSYGYGYGGMVSGPSALEAYRKRYNADPMLYNWDLQGYGSLQFPEQMVATLAGWSDKMFDIMKLVETDKQALVNTIKAIEI